MMDRESKIAKDIVASQVLSDLDSEIIFKNAISALKKRNKELEEEVKEVEKAWEKWDERVLSRYGLIDNDLDREISQLEQERSDASDSDEADDINDKINEISEVMSEPIKSFIDSTKMLIKQNNDDAEDIEKLLDNRRI